MPADCSTSRSIGSAFSVSQVTAYVAFLFSIWGASVRDLIVAPPRWVSAAAMRRSTADAACLSMAEMHAHGLGPCRADVEAAAWVPRLLLLPWAAG
jgi:hypothetical protein